MSNRKHRDNQEICARKVRELAQSGVNKHCFECNQPGVTYTDVTVGSFVCTSCSGMLRGLNPPHRVKSISMTTFSQQEVEFLQNHGNEVGRRTWLCLFEPKADGCSDMKDLQKFKEYLQDKYEKKKWHFSKMKNCRDMEGGPWSPGVQAVLAHGPLAGQHPPHSLPPNARPARMLSQMSPWDRAPAISPADVRADVFTARPSRSQSFRDAPLKDHNMCGIERQRPGSLSSALGGPTHGPSFPALPRPSASSSFKNHFTLGRAVSASGTTGPFRAFPKSLSLDFGGLKHTQAQPPVPLQTANAQDRFAAVSHLDSVFSDTAPPAGPPQYSSLFASRLSSSSTPASSPGVETVSSSQTFANFPNPFSSGTVSQQPTALSPSNPFSSPPGGDSSAVLPPPASFPPEAVNNQEANGFAALPASDEQPKVPRPMSVNPFTGNVYPSQATSRNPFI
ncbi:arf-GAP domain and FG repeat-containing protein 2 isoform X1 [Nerophis lumbriciformis]|uniref:arf-GAP domain and FG repeat-containing protein 2 isoform X1 n=2 Tax=Nerophis lumbriciformis TaxID=546530 RepID=UPI002ADF937E|nr:arf-GAP domain and FG repeat-containing protein 1-like isoform X1 [Nerophis lumbriciformis]XP_061816054.1 arf-GAP domain and FG repeat-containing protein 1-like isoform X1 [Nerophis lumbriciformis]XP_061816055.1 arf-GAP domain and FG repeat-containing protein 1-like isoform X1 [Nerophis lumbriciformis]